MESIASQNENETPAMVYHFVSSHAAGISNDKKQFSGAWISDPGPSFARCQPIENNPIVIDKDGQRRTPSAIPATIIFRIVENSDYYSSCSLGIHTNVEHEHFLLVEFG